MLMRRRTDDKAEVSMSPLIDAVFLLLIFFLVATMLKQEDRDIDITPPQSRSAVKLPPDDDVVVVGIDAAGLFYWQGRPATANMMHQRLREIAAADRSQRIRLDADADTPFERVAEVLDMCRFRGLENVGIRTYDPRYNTR